MQRYNTVDDYVESNTLWPDELRQKLLSTGLTEEVKWGAPCYTHSGKNIVGRGAFRPYFGLWYFEGAALACGERRKWLKFMGLCSFRHFPVHPLVRNR